jgi:hypothetical protein
MKKLSQRLLIVLFLLSFSTAVYASELPFEVGDTIGFVPARSDRMAIKSALVKEIRGRWFYVEAKGGGSEWNSWYNSDQTQNIWIEKRAKKDGQK